MLLFLSTWRIWKKGIKKQHHIQDIVVKKKLTLTFPQWHKDASAWQRTINWLVAMSWRKIVVLSQKIVADQGQVPSVPWMKRDKWHPLVDTSLLEADVKNRGSEFCGCGSRRLLQTFSFSFYCLKCIGNPLVNTTELEDVAPLLPEHGQEQ